MGGDVTLESSKPGEGSTFHVQIQNSSHQSLTNTQSFKVGAPPLLDASGAATQTHVPELLHLAAKTGAATDMQTLSAKTASERHAQLLSGLRILVVEDAYENQVLLQRLLAKDGADVKIASNGREGVTTALKHHFDVVLMDIQMPTLDGYGATKELRQAGYNRHIIALTAYAMEEEKQRCIRVGCNGHLSKPINRTALLETILNAIT
jgi:CheY-like chemotaxis protein